MVSVIIPAYNRENLIQRAIMSVLNQTYSDLEVIVVDDCSTDLTGEIVQSIPDARLKYFKFSKNQGACAARNFGIKQASGEFIAFQDSDDVWKNNKLEVQLAYMKANKADLAFCQVERHDFDEKIEKIYPVLSEGFVPYEILITNSLVSTQTIIGRKAVFEQITFDVNMPRMQDFDFIIRAARISNVFFVNQALVDVYLQNNSITTYNYKKLIEVHQLLLTKYADSLQEYPTFKLQQLSNLGYAMVKNGNSGYEIYKEVFRTKKNVNNFIKMFLSKFNLLRYIW